MAADHHDESRRDQLSPEDERLIHLLEQSASLPEHVRALLIQRILTPDHEREAERSATESKPHEIEFVGQRARG